MRMPFAQIIEPFITVPGSFEEGLDRVGMEARDPHERRGRAAGPLDRDFGHAKHSRPDKLAEQDAADFPPAGRAEFGLHLVLDGVRKQQFHRRPWRGFPR